MIYSKTILAASGGSASIPIDTDITVTNGLIYQTEIYFPPGSSGLLHTWINDGAFQVWPSSPGESFYGNDLLITFPDKYWIQAPDHKLKIWYYNLDDTYDHTFTVRLGQVLKAEFIASFLPSMNTDSIEKMIAEIMTSQNTENEIRQKATLDYFTGLQIEDLPEGN